MSTQKVTIAAIFLLIVFSSILVSVHAIETIELSGGRQAARGMILISGDSVTGTVTCIDNEVNITNPVDFWIEDDDGNAIASYDDTLGTSFSFVAAKNGTYTLCFRNNANVYTSTEARFTLDYSRNKPEDSILSGNTPYIIMTAAAVTLAVIFAFVAFRRRKQPLPPPPTNACARCLTNFLSRELRLRASHGNFLRKVTPYAFGKALQLRFRVKGHP